MLLKMYSYHGTMLTDFLFKIYRDMRLCLVSLHLMIKLSIKLKILWINGSYHAVKIY